MATSKGELLASILYPHKMLFKYDEELPIVVLLLLVYGIVCFAISIVFQVRVIMQLLKFAVCNFNDIVAILPRLIVTHTDIYKRWVYNFQSSKRMKLLLRFYRWD